VRKSHEVTVRDHAYGAQPIRQTIAAGGDGVTTIVLDTRASRGWYDFSVLVAGAVHYEKRHAGRVETGADGISDPCMGESRKTS